MATNNASDILASETITTSFEVIYRETFHKANGLNLQGWLQTWELWEESGVSKNAFAKILVDGGYFEKVSTINQNLGHIKWVIEENGYEDASEILADYSGMGEIRGERDSHKEPKAPETKAPKATKAKAFNAKAEAKNFTEEQIIAMLVEKKKG
jgi:hypothetical protein